MYFGETEGNRISERFLSKPSFSLCSLAWACLALPGPCPLARNLEMVSVTCFCCALKPYCASLRQQDKWRRIVSLYLSLPCSLLAQQCLCVWRCPCPTRAVGRCCFPGFTGDHGSRLRYQCGAEVIPFSVACLVSVSETAVSTAGLALPVCSSAAEPVGFSALCICTQQDKFKC